MPLFDTPDILTGVWSGAGGWLAGMMLLGVAIMLLLWRWWAGLARVAQPRRRSVLRRVAGDEGTATIEFALVFPVLLVMILALIQTTFAFTGVLFVNYAAFAAARSAIVEVPRDLRANGAEGRNVVAGVESQKRENIRGVAAFAMMPVSGPGSSATRHVGEAVDELYTAEGLATPRWSDSLVDGRLAYALDHTDVELWALGPPADATDPNAFNRNLAGSPGAEFGYRVAPNAVPGAVYRYGPRDPIQVVVRHRFHLSVPFVGRLFGSGTHQVDGMASPYRVIRSDFALTNEGIWQELPPSPRDSQSIPRLVP